MNDFCDKYLNSAIDQQEMTEDKKKSRLHTTITMVKKISVHSVFLKCTVHISLAEARTTVNTRMKNPSVDWNK